VFTKVNVIRTATLTTEVCAVPTTEPHGFPTTATEHDGRLNIYQSSHCSKRLLPFNLLINLPDIRRRRNHLRVNSFGILVLEPELEELTSLSAGERGVPCESPAPFVVVGNRLMMTTTERNNLRVMKFCRVAFLDIMMAVKMASVTTVINNVVMLDSFVGTIWIHARLRSTKRQLQKLLWNSKRKTQANPTERRKRINQVVKSVSLPVATFIINPHVL